MDVQDINNVFVAKNCNRTDLAALSAETIDGKATSGVQIHAPLIDAGTAAASYYGAGELVITDDAGKVLDVTTALKSVPAIQIHQRSADGLHHYGFKSLKGANIKSYNILPYKAPVEQVVVVHTITTTIAAGTAFTVKIRRIGSETNAVKYPTVKSVTYVAKAGDNAQAVLTALVALINTNFNKDIIIPVTAVVTSNNAGMRITALPLKWELGKFFYKKLNFTVELSFDATVLSTISGPVTYSTVTSAQATKGIGNYEQVAEAELFAKLYTGANTKVQSPAYRRTIVPIDAVSTETYDTLVINWENIQGAFSANVRQEGSVTIYLPVTDNGTNQVGVADIGIVPVLDNYIVTEWGVGTAQAGKLT